MYYSNLRTPVRVRTHQLKRIKGSSSHYLLPSVSEDIKGWSEFLRGQRASCEWLALVSLSLTWSVCACHLTRAAGWIFPLAVPCEENITQLEAEAKLCMCSSSVGVKVTLQKISLLFDKVLRNQFHTRIYTSGPSSLIVAWKWWTIIMPIILIFQTQKYEKNLDVTWVTAKVFAK